MLPTTVECLRLALEYQQHGRFQEAERIYREVLERHPDHPDALHLLGVLAALSGRPQLAAALIARAIDLNPSAAPYHNNLGNVLQDLGRLPESLLCYREALRLDPSSAEALVNMGNALNRLDRFPEALGCYLEAHKLRPDSAALYTSLALALLDQGDLQEAAALIEEALRLSPEDPRAHGARALLWLLTGDWERGFREYEWRWALQPAARRRFAEPEWDGAPLEGRRIFIHCEQGLGDFLQFVRYVTLVAEAGGRVLLESPENLAALAATVPGVEQVLPAGEPPPAFDVHAPLLSLPRIFGTRPETAPAQTPYLRAPDAPEEPPWPPDCRFRVGLAWAGSPTHRNDRRRSLSLAQLAPLAKAQDVVFVSLQKGPAAEEAPPGLELETLPGRWNQLPWLAAAVERLDLVISVDTMQAHLAGALGRPVWLLLPFTPDWRWMLHREDTPWYPTMRLFRQPKPGDWATVLERVAEELGRLRPEARHGDSA